MSDKIKCSCGGEMKPKRNEFDISPFLKKPPHNKKKRILKKLMKEYNRDCKIKRVAIDLLSSMQPPHFVCDSCGSIEGFYSAMGRNLIHVEELPKGPIVKLG